MGKGTEEGFAKSKKLLQFSDLLFHFDSKLEITLACDVLSYGVGAVLAHKMPDGTERPVGYVSRSLSSAEINWRGKVLLVYLELNISILICSGIISS